MLFWIWIGLLALAWFPCCGGGGITPTSECTFCAGSDANAACFAVSISGMSDDSCSDCESYDGTYITGGSVNTGLGYCEWTYENTEATTCSVDEVGISVQYGTGFPNQFQVIFMQLKGSSVNLYFWRQTSPGTLNCLTLTDYAVPYYTRSIAILDAGVSCFNSSATCEVSANACA